MVDVNESLDAVESSPMILLVSRLLGFPLVFHTIIPARLSVLQTDGSQVLSMYYTSLCFLPAPFDQRLHGRGVILLSDSKRLTKEIVLRKANINGGRQRL